MSTLFLVATPIGNLSDIAPRVTEVLTRVDHIFAEDTRRTRPLLAHLGVTGKPLSRLDAQATEQDIQRALTLLANGQSVALLTDAGTPAISDPGTALVRACHERAIPVSPIPGPSAVPCAVAASGLVEGPFLFFGFLPRKGSKRREAVQRIAASREPVVLFEAPTRIQSTLRELAEPMPERAVCIARELTKKFEEVRVAPARWWAEQEREWKGELTLVIAANPSEPREPISPQQLDAEIRKLLARGKTVKEIVEELREWVDLPRRALYQAVLELGKNQ